MIEPSSGESFGQVVYAKIKSNGKTELVPIKLYVDGSIELLESSLSPAPPSGNDKILLSNRYEIQRVLGQGGFGRTYLTLDRYRFDEPCVVKEFLPPPGGEVEAKKSRELFEREAKILYQLDCAQIPKFFACFEEEDRLFLVQEYIQGQTYAELSIDRQQQGHNFCEAEIIELLTKLLPVLTYLHERQILHRDIAPDNIMRSERSQLPVLIDFGIGRSAIIQNREREQNLARTTNLNTDRKSIVGKLGYAPYEQIWLGKSYPSSDLYALAATAIVLMTGLNPQTPSLREIWHAQATVSEGLVKILNRMWEETPVRRYQTAVEVLADLERLGANPQPRSSLPPRHNVPLATIAPTEPPANNLSADFIARCERELLDFIGPIAKFLVKDTLATQPHLSGESLVFALARHISQPDRALEFRNRLLS